MRSLSELRPASSPTAQNPLTGSKDERPRATRRENLHLFFRCSLVELLNISMRDVSAGQTC